ncbi:hypothetical protein [Escherichia sp. E1130]|uniref:hypothetical protein n=1 Tax=Escherichia sp. E1130 TaxID=2041645 RepID=UPI001080ABE4|nr:hypothetical protein [Escherichia sp. E1130]TGC20688.1 hypothetical protein CQJ27_26040 [Escherichia sp. E1130]
MFNDVINELESSDDYLKGENVLERLKKDVGISVKITVKDTDGEDDVYIKTHTVNSSDGNSLSEYFKHIAKQIADYVIIAIRDPDGENEGNIYITDLTFEYVIPNKQRNFLLLSDLDIHLMGIFNAYNSHELLNPSSSEYGSQLQNYAVKVRGELAGNNTSGFVQSKLLIEAIKRAVRYHRNNPGRLEGYDRGINRTSYDEVEFYNHVIKEILQAFFKTETYLLRQQQRALIVAQPSQAEFISRAICKYFSIDERKWPLVITVKADIDIILTAESSGAVVTKYSNSEQLTQGKRISLFELLYDNEFRALIGGAPNKQEAISYYVDKLKGKLELNDDEVLNLKDKISELVSSYNLFIASFPSQEGIPDDLQKPINGFNIFNEKYVGFAMGVWRNLEAEIIIKEAPDAFDRITKNKSNTPYVELLTDEEKKILDDRCEHVRRHFELARNKDNFKDLPTKWASLEKIIWRDIVKPVLSNSPSLIGQAIIFVDDLVNATDAEDIVIQGLFVVSGILAKIRSPTANGLSKFLNFGTNSVLIVRSAYDYQKAVKEHRWDSANQSLVMLFMSAHGHLEVAESIFNDFITQREKVIEEVQNKNSKSEHAPPTCK